MENVKKRIYEPPTVQVLPVADVIAASNPDVDPGGWTAPEMPEIEE